MLDVRRVHGAARHRHVVEGFPYQLFLTRETFWPRTTDLGCSIPKEKRVRTHQLQHLSMTISLFVHKSLRLYPPWEGQLDWNESEP